MPLPVLTADDFKSTVVAVPPIALTAGLDVAPAPNRALAQHIAGGGVRILLYGGNANLYHYSLAGYEQALDMMVSLADIDVRVITSIGPDLGKALDQAPLVARAGIRNVMLLPVAFPSDANGIGLGVRKIAERLGHGVVLYVKREGYVDPATLEHLVADKAVHFVKYAVERSDPAEDPYLDSLVHAIGANLIASGMGERPVADHVGRRKLATFTSGAVCIAPAAAMEILRLYRSGRSDEARDLSEPFLAFERLRSRLGGIQVLHDAVTTAVADMGPMLPMVSNVGPQFMDEVREAAARLSEVEAKVAALLAA